MKNIFLLTVVAFSVLACTTAKQTTAEPSTALATSTEVFFRATGNEPFWGLTISEADIQLKSLADDTTYSFPQVTPTKAMDGNVKMYRTQNAETKIEITIQQMECVNDMSGEASPYAVTIRLEKKNARPENFKGCGNYQLPVRFHDIWTLEELNGKKVTAANFAKQIPYFEIDSKTSHYTGYGGCNGMSGTLFYEPGVLRFERGISTLMHCGDSNKENELQEALRKVTQYEFEELRLILSNPNGTLVVMKKVD